MSPAERLQLAADLRDLFAQVDRIQRRVERHDRVLAWNLSPAINAIGAVADGMLDNEDGSRLPA